MSWERIRMPKSKIADRDEKRRREGRCKMCGFPPEMEGELDERGYCLDCIMESIRDNAPLESSESEEEDDNQI